MPIPNLEWLTKEVSTLFVAYRAGAAEEDVTVYVDLISKNLEPYQWSYAFNLFTQEIPEDGRGMFMPTVAQLVHAGTGAPVPFKRSTAIPPRSGRGAFEPFWKSEAEQEFFEAVVHDNVFEPETENPMDYIQRIAIIVGAKPLSALMEFRPRNAARFAGAVRRFRESGGEIAEEGDVMPCGCKGAPGILATMAHLVAKHAWSRDELATWLGAETVEPAPLSGTEA